MKLLLVGSPSSIHTARFVALLREMGHRIHLFQSEPWYAEDELLAGVTLYVARPKRFSANRNKLRRWPKKSSWAPDWLARMLGKEQWEESEYGSPEDALERLIKRLKPDGIISLKMQNDGYTVANVRERMLDFPPWLHFGWGTDIEYFAKDADLRAEHLPKVRKVLNLCDFYVADCMRDLEQAPGFGLRGERLGAFLANGGFDLVAAEKQKAEAGGARNLVLVKARQWLPVSHGRKLVEALVSIQNEFHDLDVKFMMGDEEINALVREAAANTGARFQVLPTQSYDELLRLFARARFTVAATTVDGTPSFLVESMLMGALPVHTDMASIREWVTDGENGILYSLSNADGMIAAIRKAINDDALVKRAEAINWKIAKERMNRDDIRARFSRIVDYCFGGAAARPPRVAPN